VLLLLWVLAKVCVFYIFPWQTQEEKNVKNKWFLGFFSSIARLPRESAIDCQISIYSVPTGSQNIIRRVLNYYLFFLIINISYLHFSQFPLPMVGTSELVYLGE
jgi:hypothetical protein